MAFQVLNFKKDMESSHPMDRLLCGDVGFGKTEVAFRAIFKAVNDGKQACYLCPTTILSSQQYSAAKSRFSTFPAREIKSICVRPQVGQETTSIPPLLKPRVFKISFADLISSTGSPVRDTRIVSPIP